MTPNGKTICLNMIVKNETPTIGRCLASVRPFIDSWVIVDTGSSDGTQKLIRETLADLPGELFERPWRDFASNRSEALELARGRADYLLVVDADEVMTADEGFTLPALDRDCYDVPHKVKRDGASFQLVTLFATHLPWRYESPVHEVLVCDRSFTLGRLDGVCVIGWFDSARNQVDARTKYMGDAAVLEAALQRDPNNPRYTYYLAQSYRDAGECEKAIEFYERRATLGGWDEEVWSALYQAGSLRLHIQQSVAAVSATLLRAYQARPRRAEPLVLLAAMHRLRKEYALAHLYASKAASLPRPDDRLFLNEAVYAWQALDEQAVAASWLGQFGEALRLCDRLLTKPELPESERVRIADNRAAFAAACGLFESVAPEPATTPPAELRVAVVTPYYQERPQLLAQCHDSVRKQTYACTHVLVADGHPQPQMAQADALHIVLPRAHQDNGNTARMIGAMSAMNQGFDAVAFLDADNWYEPDHIARMVALHRRTQADVCTAARWVVREDGSPMFVDWECDGVDFVDTSCFWLTGRALNLIPLWGAMPRGGGPIGDRVFWRAVINQGLSRAHDPHPSVAFRSRYRFHYEHAGETPPPDAKSIEMVQETVDRFARSSAAASRCLSYLYPAG
jgi:glycosyltransferase involved in cell wall biosynthesis